MTVRSCELDRGSACPPAGGERRVDPFDLSRELSGDVGELPECAGDRAERDAFQRLAELGDGPIKALPLLLGPATRTAPGTQLVGELHVASARMRTVGEPELVGMTQRCRLLLGGVCDRPHALCEPQIGRRLDAGLERVAPAPVGELHLLDRDTRIAAHDSVPAAGPTAMMWSAICRGAGVGPDARLGSRASCPWAYAGDASDISVRSTSDRRTRHSRPTRTARSRPVLIQIRTVAGWIFSSALTCGTVSHGSSPASGVLEIASGIECVDGPRREIYQLGKSEHRRAHNGGILPGGTAASQMDDQSGKVIDGTARARHWRRSRTETRADDRETEVRSDAPKGFAASLLVPADMLDGVPGDIADLSTAATVSARDGTTEEDGRGTEGASAEAPEHRNPFLMPEAEAAVMRAPAKRGFSRFGARAVITRLIAWPELLTRPAGRASPCHQARSARRRRGERVRCGRHWRRRPHRYTPWFGPLTIDTKRRSNRLTRPAKRHLAAHQAAPSPAISDSTSEGPHQPRRSTAQSPDTCFASHRGCGSLHDTADSN